VSPQVDDGHLLGAAGGIEAIVSVHAITRDQSEPTINLITLNRRALDACRNEARRLNVTSVLATSSVRGANARVSASRHSAAEVYLDRRRPCPGA
jgi:3-oxoacyl-(acyl-carrier-protein) synthase